MSFDYDRQYGFFTGGSANEHIYDVPLCNVIIELLQRYNIKSVVDLGCGGGQYTKAINDAGIYCEGYDGNPDTEQITDGLCKVLNIANPIELDKKFDAVLSLEVGEHIPEKFQDIFIKNIVDSTSKLAIVSWAIPNQPGLGHVNTLSNDIVQQEFRKHDFARILSAERLLRDAAKMHYFKNTILVFERL
jgi:2-polyprenyl-3-methyl-5-hydroxy-6-metoxy-1,4-benzoquinol methylase